MLAKLVSLLKALRIAGKATAGKLLSFLATGRAKLIGISMYVIYHNREGVAESVSTLNPVPAISSFGESLALADKRIALEAAEVLTGQAQGLGVLVSILTIAGNLVFILWYFRFVHFASGKILGSGNAPKVYTYLLAFIIWGLSIVAVTQEIPFQGVWYLAENFEGISAMFDQEVGLGPEPNLSENMTSNFSANTSEINRSIYDGLST